MAETVETAARAPVADAGDIAFRDDDGDVNLLFVERVADAVALGDSAGVTALGGDLHEASRS
jgi:hypothetical protein